MSLAIFERITHIFEHRPFGEEVNIELWYNFLLIIEMPFLAILMHFAFPVEDSLHGDKDSYLHLSDSYLKNEKENSITRAFTDFLFEGNEEEKENVNERGKGKYCTFSYNEQGKEEDKAEGSNEGEKFN